MATASQSLFRMTVAADQAGTSQGLLMPKLQYRFRALFYNMGPRGSQGTDLTKQVMDITRPQVQFDEVTLDVYNSRIYLAGKHSWQETTINLRDDAQGTVTKLVGQQLQKQMDFMEQASAATGSDYKFEIHYQVLDGGNGTYTPNVLETWELYGCFIKTANYNNMDYKTSDPATIQLSIRFDNAVQTPVDTSGVGTNVGRAFGTSTATGIAG
jgi:hypothetical protein